MSERSEESHGAVTIIQAWLEVLNMRLGCSLTVNMIQHFAIAQRTDAFPKIKTNRLKRIKMGQQSPWIKSSMLRYGVRVENESPRWTKKARVISDRTKTQCFAPALVQRKKFQKISRKYVRIIQKL
jgi:hypothetical protein